MAFGANGQIQDKYHKIMMVAARFGIGNYGYKKSCNEIMKRLGLKTSKDQIEESAAKWVNAVMKTKKPRAIIHHI